MSRLRYGARSTVGFVAAAALLATLMPALPASASTAPSSQPPAAAEAEPPSAPDVPARSSGEPAPAPGDHPSLRPTPQFDPAKAKLLERTERNLIYENPDGTRTLRAFSGAISWKDARGMWQAIDPTVVAAGERGFKNRSGRVNFSFAPRADAAQLVRASTPKWSVGFGYEGARGASDPVASGSRIRYPGVADGVELEYDVVGSDMLKELVVLNRPLAAGTSSVFRFPLTVSRLTPRSDKDGTIGFYDAEGTRVAEIPKGTMFDSSADAERGIEPAQAPVEVRLVKDDGRFVVEVEADRAWLDDAARVYPVSIDPTFVAGRHTSSWDAFVGSGCGGCNYSGGGQWDGSAYVNKIGYSWYNGATWEWRSYLKYDVNPANGQDILRADWWGGFYSVSHADSLFVMRPAAAAWDEWSLTWDNQPGGCCSEVFGRVNSGQWVSTDLRPWVHNWTHGLWGNGGIEVDNYGQGHYLRLAATESVSERSYIDVTYNLLADTPSSPAPAYQWITTTTPTLCATYSDANGDQGYLRFNIHNSAGTWVGNIVSGWVASGSRACATVPAGWVGEGYMWYHAYAFDGYGWTTGYADVWVRIDTTGPTPTLSSSTHQDQNAWYASRSFAASWAAPADASGISGYAVAAPTTSPGGEAGSAVTQTTTGYAATVAGDGQWYLNVRARDGAGNWGLNARYGFKVDATGPGAPSVAADAPHVCNSTTWSNDTTPSFKWSASDLSGINGYSYVMNQSEVFTLDDTSEGTLGEYTSVARADGTWWFHVKARNGAGVWGQTARCKVLIDAGLPAAPIVSSSSHSDKDKWYANRTVALSWVPGASTSPVVDYAYDPPDQIAERDPEPVGKGSGLDAPPYTVNADGTWYFHVRAKNAAGAWGQSANFAFNVDVTPPAPPGQVLSATHPAGIAVSNRKPTMTWTPGSDAHSGVAGYSWSFTTSSTEEADAAADGDATTLSATSTTDLSDGIWWFNVKTVDRAGNASTNLRYGPIVVDQNGPAALSPTLPPVAEAASDELGLEQFYPYRRLDFGTATGYVHLRTGNLVVSQDETTISRQGLNAVVRRVYNSSDTRDPDGMGPGWRLSVSDTEAGLEGVTGVVTELDAGAGLAVANLVDAAGAVTGQLVEFSDGDGTTHRFVRPGGPGTRWESPPGVSLRLREVSGGFELVRPDGVVYHAQNIQSGLGLPQWRITSVADRHANRLTYGYDAVGTLGAMRLVKITHNRDDGQQALVTFHYDNGKLMSIKSLPGLTALDPATGAAKSWERLTTLSYVDGRLSAVKRNAHPDAAGGAQLSDFAYTGGLLSAVTDGRRKTTTLAYDGSGNDAKLQVVTDRRAKDWTFAYGGADADGGRVTTTTDPTGAKVRYTISGRAPLADGRTAGANIVAIADDGTDAGPVRSSYTWVDNRLVTSTDGVGNASSTEYNDLGLVTKITRPAPNDAGRGDLSDPAYPKAAVVTTLSYRYPPGFGYSGCSEPTGSGPVTSAGWCQMVADLERSAAADNVATQRRVTDFDPDPTGKVISAARRAAPSGAASAGDRIDGFSYYSRGGLCSADGPRADVGDVTRFGDAANTAGTCAAAPDPAYGGYDITGRPPRVLDALGKASDVVHTPYGRVAKSTDREGRVTTAVYDDRDNLIRVSDPVGSVTTMSYDANDNKVSETSPRGNASSTDGDFETRFSYDDNDWATAVSWPGKDEAAPRAQVTTAYNHDGTKAAETNAVGGVTEYAYFANRMLKQTKAPATTSGPKALTDYRYDAAGRVVRTIHPGVDAAGTSRPEELIDYTPQGDVSIRRQTSATPGVWRTTRYAYNAHGESAQEAGPRTVAGEEERSERAYNGFGQVELTRRRLVGRWLETPTSYDTAGNPTATSTLTGTNEVLTATYRYDALGRVAAQTTDPTNPGHKVAFTYDAEGAQLTRVDSRQTGGPASGACSDAGVSCETLRTTTNAYNRDATLASSVSTDAAGQGLATCNYAGSDPASGYDADKHPLVVRTLSATTACSGGTLEREVTMSYDHRGLVSTMAQKVRGDSAMVSRSQSFEHRPDTTVSSVTHDGRTTAYGRSPAGWSESISAEAEPGSTKASSFSYSPAGGLTGSALGSGTASSTRAYTPDGMVASLVWSAAGTTVRSHTNLAYDLGGLRTAETVNVVHPATATGTDPGGPASYSYDLARRLVSYTSPYKADPLDTAEPSVAYGLDDGANIATATTTVGGQTRVAESSTYPGGRLATRSSTTTPAIGAPVTADTAFSYSPLGEETQRTTTAAGITSTTTTGYDAAGHVSKAVTVTPTETEGVDYVYDGADHLLARRSGGETTLYFYWGPGSTLAEETDGAGQSLARYVVDGAEPVAQHTFRRILGGGKDPTDTAGTWAWILDDPAGNAATTVGDDGAVLSQAAFDPYGVPEATGNSKAPGPDAKTSLGFQSALTDPTTAKVILGPRQYDPKTARFTNPDVFVGAGADVALGTDPLTGNRYLFAGANPVAYYEDGHCFGKERKLRTRVGSRLGPRYEVWIADPNHYGGGFYAARFDTLPVYKTETKCDRSLGSVVAHVGDRPFRQAAKKVLDAVGTTSSVIATGAAGVSLACLASVVAAACSVPAAGTAGVFGGISLAANTGSAAIACAPEWRSRPCLRSGAQLGVSLVGFATARIATNATTTLIMNAADAVASIGSWF